MIQWMGSGSIDMVALGLPTKGSSNVVSPCWAKCKRGYERSLDNAQNDRRCHEFLDSCGSQELAGTGIAEVGGTSSAILPSSGRVRRRRHENHQKHISTRAPETGEQVVDYPCRSQLHSHPPSELHVLLREMSNSRAIPAQKLILIPPMPAYRTLPLHPGIITATKQLRSQRGGSTPTHRCSLEPRLSPWSRSRWSPWTRPGWPRERRRRRRWRP